MIKVSIMTKNNRNIIKDDYGYDYDNYSDDDSDYDIREQLSFNIKCLGDLSLTLEQNIASAQRALKTYASVPERFHLSDPAITYAVLIGDKFKRAQDQLVERLAEANWQRHTNVRKQMTALAHSTSVTEPDIGCSTFRPYSMFHDSGIGTSVHAHTLYAPSHTSF